MGCVLGERVGAAHIFNPRRRAEMRTFHGVFVYSADDIAKRYKVSESKARKMLYEAKMLNDTLQQRGLIMVCEFNDYIKAKGGARSVLQ